MWQMENALRDECGYTGSIPYWDQPRFSEIPLKSKVFDSAWFGGDGEYDPEDHGPYDIRIPGLAANITITRPEGHGGGCVKDGAFAGFQVSLGPTERITEPANKYGYQPNPRCLERNFDLSQSIGSMNWANATKIVDAPDIATFRTSLDELWHKNSHTFLGKDGVDLFTSPNEPIFYLLHSQIDRLWALWQGQDLAQRTFAIDGPRTFLGIPLDTAPNVQPSNATIEDVMDLGYGYHPRIKEGMAMTAGGRCYMYE